MMPESNKRFTFPSLFIHKNRLYPDQGYSLRIVFSAGASVFLVQNDFYGFLLQRSRAQENARGFLEVVEREVGSLVGGALVSTDSTRMVLRTPQTLGAVCRILGTDHYVHFAAWIAHHALRESKRTFDLRYLANFSGIGLTRLRKALDLVGERDARVHLAPVRPILMHHCRRIVTVLPAREPAARTPPPISCVTATVVPVTVVVAVPAQAGAHVDEQQGRGRGEGGARPPLVVIGVNSGRRQCQPGNECDKGRYQCDNRVGPGFSNAFPTQFHRDIPSDSVSKP